MIVAAGYSSRSTWFLLMFSMISLFASSGIHVCTNLHESGSYIIKRRVEWCALTTRD
jgi:hypothetical protein